MKDVPKIYPIALLLIIVFIFFVAAWAISEGALNRAEAATGVTAPEESAVETLAFHERAAVWVCPLH
ncbi:MAG: hypothetical protein FJ317_03140 [SAR202 cluster bacterium]|nr:hypothetical protein [SAR202 cluster bacterium]